MRLLAGSGQLDRARQVPAGPRARARPEAGPAVTSRIVTAHVYAYQLHHGVMPAPWAGQVDRGREHDEVCAMARPRAPRQSASGPSSRPLRQLLDDQIQMLRVKAGASSAESRAGPSVTLTTRGPSSSGSAGEAGTDAPHIPAPPRRAVSRRLSDGTQRPEAASTRAPGAFCCPGGRARPRKPVRRPSGRPARRGQRSVISQTQARQSPSRRRLCVNSATLRSQIGCPPCRQTRSVPARRDTTLADP